MNRLHKIKVLGEHRLAVKFTDGWSFEINLEALREGPGIAAALTDEGYFQQVFIDHGVLTWPNGYDLCSDVLRAWCEAGRVLNDAETDASCAAMAARASGQSAA
jgi:hypothetical protein